MNPANLALYLVTDAPEVYRESLLANVEAAVAGGVSLVQYRAETGSRRQQYEAARALADLLRPRSIPFIINNHLDLALAVGADGIHLGQSDLPVEVARRLLGSKRLLGLSITAASQLAAVDSSRVDYLGIGPVFGTVSKDDAAPALGLDGFAEIARRCALPKVAIGGIGLDAVAPLIQAGADGIAVVSALSRSDDPASSAREFRRAIEAAR